MGRRPELGTRFCDVVVNKTLILKPCLRRWMTYRETVDALPARNRKTQTLGVPMMSASFNSNSSIKSAVGLEFFSFFQPVSCG